MQPGESRSSRALDRVLNRGGPKAEAVLALVKPGPMAVMDRTSLWRYRNGKTTPPADVASKIHAATRGTVPANGWASDSEKPVGAP